MDITNIWCLMLCSQNQQGRSALQVSVCLAQCPLLLSLSMWSSAVALSPQYLCHQQPLSLLGGAEWGTHGRKGWEINAKTTQLSGSESRHKDLSPGTKPTLGRRGFCLLPAHQLSSKLKIYTNMCFLHSPPKAETTSKSGLGQRSVIRQGQAISKVLGKRT